MVIEIVAVIAKNLYKKYGNKLVLNNINLEILEGEIFGLLGPNGSGKSTLMRILAGTLKYDFGQVLVESYDPNREPIEIRKIVGYVPETPVLYESLTPREYFEFIGSMRAPAVSSDVLEKRVDELANAFGISEYMDNFIGSLSFGTKQKVSIISSLLHNPKILILDESINGLDPKSAKIFKNLLIDLSKEGKIIIFSTHILEIAQNICKKVSIMDKGSVKYTGSIEDVSSQDKNLEEVFLKLTSSEDIDQIVKALKESITS